MKVSSPIPKEYTLFVDGMHCSSCEVLLEKKLRTYEGVTATKAFLSDKKVNITLKDSSYSPNIEKLNKDFSDLGYTFSLDDTANEKLDLKGKALSVLIAVFISVGMYLLNAMGFLSTVSLNSDSAVITFFFFGIIASLSSCASLVGGILLSLTSQWKNLYDHSSSKFTPYVLFNVGRLLSFALLGGLLGIFGSLFRISLTASVFISMLISVIMMILGLQMLGTRWALKLKLRTPKFISKYITDEKNFTGKYMPATVGALTFFVPCGFTLIAQMAALSSESFVRASYMMLAFAFGTLPMLILISLTSVSLNSSKLFSKYFNYVAGTLVILFSLYTFNSQINVLGLASLNDLLHSRGLVSSPVGNIDTIRVVQVEVKDLEYLPREIRLKAGVPVRMEITNNGAVGCARALYANGLIPDVIYLQEKVTVVEFTPTVPGTYKITCTMGMVDPITVEVL